VRNINKVGHDPEFERALLSTRYEFEKQMETTRTIAKVLKAPARYYLAAATTPQI